MNWHRLKDNLCPNCKTRETLTQALMSDALECPRCAFHITATKFNSLVSAFYRKTKKINPDEEEQNLSDLSNL